MNNRANAADDLLVMFLLSFPRKQDLIIHANCVIGDNLHEMSEPVF